MMSCPKCGHPEWTEPTYVPGPYYGEGKLRRDCRRCGYSEYDIPLDKQTWEGRRDYKEKWGV